MRTTPLLILSCLVTGCAPAAVMPPPPADAGPVDSGTPPVDGGGADAGYDAGIVDSGYDAGIVDPGIISAEPGDTFQAEPTVAAGPDGVRVAAWLSFPQSVGRYQVSYAVSRDEGRTFSKQHLAATPDGWWGRSPVLASGPDGIWLAWPAIHLTGQARDDVRILASHLSTGANEVDAPIVIDDGTQLVRFGPSAVVLDSKTLVVAYTEASVTIARRDASGAISRAQLSEQGMPSLCTDGSRVYAVLENANGVVLMWSDDEGRTWPAANTHVFAPDPDLAATQPRCAAAGDSVWVMFGATADISGSASTQEILDAVLLVRSKDRGSTWSTEFDVKPPGQPYAMLPNIAAAGAEAYLAFYSGAMANDPHGATVLVRAGDALEASALIHQPIVFRTARTPPSWQGDALGIGASVGRIDVVYADNNATASHVGLFGIDGAGVGR
jgi:hypothetical protein